ELSGIEPLIAECWEVMPVWLDPVSLKGADEGPGCGVAEDFIFVADDSLVTDAVTGGDVTEVDGEVSVYELEDFDPSWVIRVGGVSFEDAAPIDDSFEMCLFDPIPLEDFELSDPVWCDFGNYNLTGESVDSEQKPELTDGDEVSVNPINEGSVIWTRCPVFPGDLEVVDPVWGDFRNYNPTGESVDGKETAELTDGTDGAGTVETLIDDCDPEVVDPVRCDFEGYDPVWCDFGDDIPSDEAVEGGEKTEIGEESGVDDTTGLPDGTDGGDSTVIGDGTKRGETTEIADGSDGDETPDITEPEKVFVDPIDCVFVIQPYFPGEPGDLQVFDPVWCDFGKGDPWNEAVDGDRVYKFTDGEESSEPVSLEESEIRIPIRYAFRGGKVSDTAVDGDGLCVFTPPDLPSSDGSEDPQPVICDFGVDFGVIPGSEEGSESVVSVDGTVTDERGETVKNFRGESVDGEDSNLVRCELPVDDEAVVDLVWEDFAGTGRWEDGSTEEIPVAVSLPAESGTDEYSGVVCESTDWQAWSTMLNADPGAADATSLVYQALPAESSPEVTAEPVVISVSMPDDPEIADVSISDEAEVREDEGSEEVAIPDSVVSESPELTYVAAGLEEELNHLYCLPQV
ncbi:MAG: hypothetical protein ACK50J_01935, partial [Planctomyces sp.]